MNLCVCRESLLTEYVEPVVDGHRDDAVRRLEVAGVNKVSAIKEVAAVNEHEHRQRLRLCQLQITKLCHRHCVMTQR